MSPRLVEIVAGAVCVFGLIWLLAFSSDSCAKKKGNSAQVQADLYKKGADSHEEQARMQDAKVSDLQAKLEATKADLDRLSNERGALLRMLAAAKQVSADPGSAHPGPAEAPAASVSDDVSARDAVIAKDAELIDALLADNGKLKDLNAALIMDRDLWKKTAEDRERQAMAQEAATNAWKKAVTTSRWTGRIEGFAAGVALGYVGGRLK
jgi:hypothetical protein